MPNVDINYDNLGCNSYAGLFLKLKPREKSQTGKDNYILALNFCHDL